MTLPPNVTLMKDRHGKVRYRFRKKGFASRYLPHPDSPAFQDAYDACFDSSVQLPRLRHRRRVRLSELKGISVVYFIGLPNGDTKIGTTINLPNRFKKLQTGCPFRMSLLAVIEGGATLESEFHTRFASLRRRGEWFNGKALKAEINQLIRDRKCLTLFNEAVPKIV